MSFLCPSSTLPLMGSKLNPLSLASFGFSKRKSQDFLAGVVVDLMQPISRCVSAAENDSPRLERLLKSKEATFSWTPKVVNTRVRE